MLLYKIIGSNLFMLTKNTPPKLLDQVRDRIRVKHYSIRTEKLYVQWIKRFILFHGKRHPLEMGAVEVEAFLTHLAVEVRRIKNKEKYFIFIPSSQPSPGGRRSEAVLNLTALVSPLDRL
ncbi:phage integrase N-terminal SAM-like domain-containing protein [Methylomicrobium lacus]|uniref:phage integrase N-terminal SAM-like domain-containing protein n=1 Tax=Methylomicrobium lacus TaxID=136992 RepID=UPI0035A9957B